MIIGAHAILMTKKPAADMAFLRDVLGLGSVDDGGYVIFGLGESELAAHEADKNEQAIYLMTDDVNALVADLKKRKIACTRAPGSWVGRPDRSDSAWRREAARLHATSQASTAAEAGGRCA